MELYSVFEAACRQISTGDKEAARTTISQEAPFQPSPREKRKYSDGQALAVFRRDGFIDRYSGTRLVFPGTLRGCLETNLLIVMLNSRYNEVF